MKPDIIQVHEIAPQAWRNGGGQTRELRRWPRTDSPWQMRISLADIEHDGPFSAFENVQRWFVVVAGAGVTLRFTDDEKQLTNTSAPLCFKGGSPPDCQLIDGPTRDLNLMVREGSGSMHTTWDRLAWRTTSAQCGLFTAEAGFIHVGAKPMAPIAAHTLVWFEQTPPSSLLFEVLHPSTNPAGWWLSFTPPTPFTSVTPFTPFTPKEQR